MLFVLTLIFSGWLSMDNGLLFSTGKPTDAESRPSPARRIGVRCRQMNCSDLGPQTIEVEWFAFDGRIYRRERAALGMQRLSVAGVERRVSPNARFSARPK